MVFISYSNSNTFHIESFIRFKSMQSIFVNAFLIEMAKWLIVWIVRLIILENRKWFLISYLNSNNYHVKSFIRFKSMQLIFVNAFLIENG